MAGLNVCVNFYEAALSVGAWRTVCSVSAPAERMLKVKGFVINTDGTDGSAKPIQYRLIRIDSGSGSSTGAAAHKANNALGATPVTVGARAYTTEPTYGSAAYTDATPHFYRGLFHPQGGITRDLTFDDIVVEEGTGLALQAKVPAGGSAVNATGHIAVEE